MGDYAPAISPAFPPVCRQELGTMAPQMRCVPGINSFPIEIMLQIFMNNTNLDMHNLRMSVEAPRADTRSSIWAIPQNFTYIDPSQPTRSVSHVCQYWREIVMNAPQIWSRLIDCELVPHLWFKEVLYRARNRPLIVLCRGRLNIPYVHGELGKFTDRRQKNLSCLLASHNQFKEFYAMLGMGLEDATARSLLERLQQPMPFLTAFSIHWGPGTGFFRMEANEFNLFGGTAPPLLQQFSLGYGDFNSHLRHAYPFFRTLTRISLENLVHYYPILPALSKMPQLQKLVLSYNIDDISYSRNPLGDQYGPCNRVQLPYLAHIRLFGPDSRLLLMLLHSLDPAELATLSCELFDYKPEEYPSKEVFQRLLAPTRFKNKPENSKATLLLSKHYSATDITTPQGHHFYIHSSSSFSRLNAALLTMHGVLFPFCTHLVLGYVDGLDPGLSSHWNLHHDDFFKIMRQLVNAEVVRFKGIPLLRILSMLKSGSDLLPSLTEVSFPCSDVIDPLELATFDVLEDLLEFRQLTGRPLRVVTFLFPKGDILPENTYERQVEFIRERFKVEVRFLEEEKIDDKITYI